MKKQLVIALVCLISMVFFTTKSQAASTNDIKKGMTGKIVMQLQVKLKEQGYYSGTPTDYFGSDVEVSLMKYQTAKKLMITGILDDQTSMALFGKKLETLIKENSTSKPSGYNPYSKKTQVTTIAKKYTGVPYRFGGTTTKGFDCSGYVGFVYNKVGTKLPRTAASMYNVSSIIKKPVPGDLVFFKNTYKKGISHVGIFVGNNSFISATSSKGVAIVSLSNTYWKGKFAGSGSVIK
jgi:peptidoglycan DL-endopeptidase LytE